MRKTGIRKSLDFARETTPLPGWMNDISSYSLWWVIIHRDLYLQHGDLTYLKAQHDYLNGVIRQIAGKISNGVEQLDGGRFLDWPTADNPDVIHAGLQALTLLALEAAADMASWLSDKELEKLCNNTAAEIKKQSLYDHNNKQAAALLCLASLIPSERAAAVILDGGANRFATFYGYYMLEALAKMGKYQEAMDIISDYWGAMLDLGATTFWENFEYEERKGAGHIDQLPDSSTFNIHADGGAYCYIGLRGSLCHGWASGPTAWLTAHVLGIKILKPGCKVIAVQPHLGNLQFAEGTFPTPYGTIKVKHVKRADGSIKSDINSPKEITVIR